VAVTDEYVASTARLPLFDHSQLVVYLVHMLVGVSAQFAVYLLDQVSACGDRRRMRVSLLVKPLVDVESGLLLRRMLD
jgi:hypothetical protein